MPPCDELPVNCVPVTSVPSGACVPSVCSTALPDVSYAEKRVCAEPCRHSSTGRVCLKVFVLVICCEALHGFGKLGAPTWSCFNRSLKRKNWIVQPPVPNNGFGASSFCTLEAW